MSPLTLRRGAPTMTSHWAQHPSRLPGDGARAGHVRPRSPLAHHAQLPRRRLAHRGHAHPRHHRRRAPDPGGDHGRAPAVVHGASRWTAEAADARAARAQRDERGDSAAFHRPDADWGVLYIEVSGLLPMCGHGTIGAATVLVETGMVEVTEPVTTVRLDTPAGLVVVEVAVRDGRAESVTLTNVPSFLMRRDAHVEVPGLGIVPYDLGFGGNFYAFVELEDLALPFDRRQKDRLLAAGLAIMEALNTADEPVHPEREDIRGVHHVYLAAPGSDARHSRHAMRSEEHTS